MKTFIVFLFLFATAFAQGNYQYIENSDYTGGLNVKNDSASLKISQGLIVDNLTFEKYGSLSKRPGLKYWNRYPLTTGQVVNDIKYFNNQTLIATQNWIYAEKGYNDTVGSTANWAKHRIGYNQGSVVAIQDSNRVYGVGTWWLLGVKDGDYLEIADTIFVIDSVLTDTSLLLNKEFKLSSRSIPCKIYRYLPTSTTQMTSWNNNLYVANEVVPPFYYDSADCRWLACVDSGTIDSVAQGGGESEVVFTNGLEIPYIDVGRYKLLINFVYVDLSIADNDTIFDGIKDSLSYNKPVFIDHVSWATWPEGRVRRTVDSTTEDGNTGRIYVSGGLNENWTGAITDSNARVVYGLFSTDHYYITDTSKSFNNENINNLFVLGRSPYHPSKIYSIGGSKIDIGNCDSMNVDSTLLHGRYYIFSSIPFANYNSPTTFQKFKSPIYKQITFHNNIMYAYGFQYDSAGTAVNKGFVYHSDIGLPKATKALANNGLDYSVCGFDLSLNANDNPTSMFSLNDALFFTTPSKIFKLMGYPPAIGSGSLVNVTSNFGIDTYNAVTVRDNNYAYMINKNGLHRFDGNNIEKISEPIEPLIDRYRTTNYELKYYRDNLYVGFNDSDYTLVYNEPTNSYSRLLFGMAKANQQSNEVDSGYFLFAHTHIAAGRIFKYPTSLYVDSITPTSGEAIGIQYKSGWLGIDQLRYDKAFDKFYTTLAKSIDTVNYRFRTDFDTASKQTLPVYEQACSACGQRYTKIINLSQNVKGRYFQWEVQSSSKNYFSLGKFGLRWRPLSEQ